MSADLSFSFLFCLLAFTRSGMLRHPSDTTFSIYFDHILPFSFVLLLSSVLISHLLGVNCFYLEDLK